MPRGNGTGPMGMGAMTGRGLGPCGGGAGYGRGFYRTGMMMNNVANDKAYYQSREQLLENELKAVKKQLEQYQNKYIE